MCAFPQQLTRCLFLLILLISIVYSFRILNDFDTENSFDDEQDQANGDRVLIRRSFYDPAFSDSWSKYFDKKRSLFDPAYTDWANTFKRSDE